MISRPVKPYLLISLPSLSVRVLRPKGKRAIVGSPMAIAGLTQGAARALRGYKQKRNVKKGRNTGKDILLSHIGGVFPLANKKLRVIRVSIFWLNNMIVQHKEHKGVRSCNATNRLINWSIWLGY